MTDVFVRVFSSSELRLGFAIATVARWKMQKDARVHILCWDGGIQHNWWKGHMVGEWVCHFANIPELPYATASLQKAEELAESDPYIICNDDNLIYGQDFVEKGLQLMADYPDYGIIAGRFVNESGHNMTERVTEIHAVGGLVFLRKGLVTEFEPLEDKFWDGYRHAQVVTKGFKSGYARDLPYLHMGAHFSIASPSHFTGA